MRKNPSLRLTLSTETVRQLSAANLTGARGGSSENVSCTDPQGCDPTHTIESAKSLCCRHRFY